MKSVNISIKYSFVAVTKFVYKEIWQKNHFKLLQEKESKLLYFRYSFFIPFNEQQKCHVTNIYTERKNKYHITLFCKKRKVSYYITFFQTLLRTFSCDLCYSERIILSHCDWKESDLCLQEEQYIPFNEQRKCHVTNIYTVEEKQKYHITFFCEKNKSIILHHVLPNSPENVFLRPLLFW